MHAVYGFIFFRNKMTFFLTRLGSVSNEIASLTIFESREDFESIEQICKVSQTPLVFQMPRGDV